MSPVEQAAALLCEGGLVAFPTETVYGLGADATDDAAVTRIYATKARPRFNPLILHIADVAAARALAHFDRRAESLAARFWPGPLTLVLPRRNDAKMSSLALAGLDTVALRAPNHRLAQSILRAVARPIAAPSANRSGQISPTTADHVAADLGDAVDLIVDGGACPVGVESTIVDLTGEPACLLRPGGVTLEEIETVIGGIVVDGGCDTEPKAPGRLARHYAPKTRLRLDADAVAGNEALLAFGPNPLTGAVATANLSPTGDLDEAAANLFAMLHDLDVSGAAAIATMAIPGTGLGVAINDRLRRAAAR
ncbi:MAG: L-threonylcarbamoyladenylate synthase [Alphaproteobacteria bacterium]